MPAGLLSIPESRMSSSKPWGLLPLSSPPSSLSDTSQVFECLEEFASAKEDILGGGLPCLPLCGFHCPLRLCGFPHQLDKMKSETRIVFVLHYLIVVVGGVGVVLARALLRAVLGAALAGPNTP
ncbi:hypothetical protein GWK47_047204 [Chionoecetes opilio]|uniref:Uncharacterized protein n=1 Tax=Chionoecetes opilio TaxID=41210 RepID=A0A8J4Y4V9_CHIOP|nr:hypothetical protein GWK47_047204 [Chionoecetes opilio]